MREVWLCGDKMPIMKFDRQSWNFIAVNICCQKYAYLQCERYDYVMIKCQSHHQRFPIPGMRSASISMWMKMYIKRHHHWGVDVTLSCTRNMWHVATKCQICPFAFSKLDSTAFTWVNTKKSLFFVVSFQIVLPISASLLVSRICTSTEHKGAWWSFHTKSEQTSNGTFDTSQ